MKNKVLKITGVLLAILLIGFIALTFSVDGLVKSAIEENGTELLQTAVRVNDVDISLFSGRGEIYGLSIANPEGFSDEPAVQIDATSLKIDLLSMFSDTIVVENIQIQNSELFFEQRGLGINLRQLNENMDYEVDPDAKAMVIDHILIENGVVRVSTTIERERTAEAEIDQFELNNIGRSGNNTVKESLRQVMEPLLERAVREAVSRGLLDQLENRVQDLFEGGEN